MRRSAVLLLVLAAVALPSAQTADGAAVGFEAATVKQNKSGGDTAGIRRSPGGRFEATNISLSALITFAYQLQPFELQGGPPWLTGDRWDVLAKSAGDPPPTPQGTPDAHMLALRTLLADRFKLVVSRATRDIDVYHMVMARPDGRPGAGLRQSTYDCLELQKARDAAARGGPPVTDPNTPERLVCGIRVGPRRVQWGGSPLSQFANMITRLAERRVVDRTGLSGNWEFDITFAQQAGPPGSDIPADPNAASLFTVLQEQLGLKLEPGRMPMPVLVVDSVERPVED